MNGGGVEFKGGPMRCVALRGLRPLVIVSQLWFSSCCLSAISGVDRNDGGLDSGWAGGIDAGHDAGLDGGLDAGPDTGVDAGPDAGDGGTDAGADSGVP